MPTDTTMPTDLTPQFAGLEIRLSSALIESATITTPRTWRDRLRPIIRSTFPHLFVYWRPWIATDTQQIFRPIPHAVVVGPIAYMHPETFQTFRRAVQELDRYARKSSLTDATPYSYTRPSTTTPPSRS